MLVLPLLQLLLLACLPLTHAFISPSLLRRRSPDSPSEHRGPFFQQDLNVNPIVRTAATARNPACARWYPIRDHILQTLFSGRCTPLARAAVRLAFHDAATFSLARQAAGQPNGGADGSMLTDPAEVQRADNNGLQGIVAALAPLPARYNVSAGDIVQVAGTLAVIVCPGGPRVRTFVGRAPPPTIPAPDGLLPSTHAAVPVLLARFADMGFSVRDTMALMGAHSTALQQFVAAADANKTLDSTPDIWDVHFYEQTLNGTADPARVASLPSDVAFAGHESTKRAWARYVRDQDDWDEDYARAHLKMSLLGQETRGMVECTEVLPPKIELGSLGQDDGGEGQGEVDEGRLELVIRKFRWWWFPKETETEGKTKRKEGKERKERARRRRGRKGR